MDSSKLARFLDQSDNFNLRGGNDAVLKGALAAPNSSPPSHYHEDEDAEGEEDEEEEDYDEDDVEEYSDDDDQNDQSYGVALDSRITAPIPIANDQSPPTSGSRLNGAQGVSPGNSPSLSSAPTRTGASPKKVKGSQRTGARAGLSGIESESRRLAHQEPHRPTIAQDLSLRLEAARLKESDDFILSTEEHVSALHLAVRNGRVNAGVRASALSNTSEQLCNLWKLSCDREAQKAPWKDEVVIGVGPDEGAPAAHSATFLSTLLLPLYHPATATGGQALAVSRFGKFARPSTLPYSPRSVWNPTPYPKVLTTWLDKSNDPFQAILSEVQNHKPNATAHEFFWDVVFKMVFRGRFAELLVILKKADFKFARTATEDGYREGGYGRTQVDNINMVISWTVQALQTCPAITDDDWHVHMDPWNIFRRRISKAMQNLMLFAEGRDKDLDSEEPSFEASNFGIKSPSANFSKSSRRAESRVPWTILQNLKTLYGMLRGGSLEIMSYSENWVEGSIALTALWDGEDDETIAAGNGTFPKRPSRTSRSRGLRLVDSNPGLAYRRRLAEAFKRVTEGPDGSDDLPMLPDTSRPIEVALSSIFEGDVSGAIGFLRTMSLPISDAVAEIGTIGGWFQASALDTAMEGFDRDDMDLLSFENSLSSGQEPRITRNLIMKDYAEALLSKDDLTGKRGLVLKGWELSIAVLARMGGDNVASSRAEIQKILHRLPLNSDAQIEKILHICYEHDIPTEGRKLVEVRSKSFPNVEKLTNFSNMPEPS